MIVISGKKTTRRRLGWVGDFCPICRELEFQQVTRVSQVPHLYFIPLGRGTIALHEIECRQCQTIFGVQQVPYIGYARRPPSDIINLISATNPGSIEHHNQRLDLEDRVTQNDLSPHDRLNLIAEPLLALNYIATRKSGKGVVPPGAAICIILLFILIPFTLMGWFNPNASHFGRWMLLGVISILAFGTFLSFWSGGKSWGRRYLIPRLARTLSPLRPSIEELDMVLAELKRQKLIVAKRVRAAELHSAIERLAFSSGQ